MLRPRRDRRLRCRLAAPPPGGACSAPTRTSLAAGCDRLVPPRASGPQEESVAARIRVGIVGATVTPGGSGWGANAHVPALRALPEYELKAVCTAHAETAAA